MNSITKPWYKKKRYLIPLGVVALAALGSGDDKASTHTTKQETVPAVRVEKTVETEKVSQPIINTLPIIEQSVVQEAEPELYVAPVQKRVEPQCNPNYSGCLKSGAGDYDCAGGSGNGPNYTGKVQVLGYDEFDLDRDHDGWGCER